MIELLSVLGVVFLVHISVALILAACFFIPPLFSKEVNSDPSGGMLSAFILFAVILLCLTWPVSLPMMWINQRKKKDDGTNQTI